MSKDDNAGKPYNSWTIVKQLTIECLKKLEINTPIQITEKDSEDYFQNSIDYGYGVTLTIRKDEWIVQNDYVCACGECEPQREISIFDDPLSAVQEAFSCLVSNFTNQVIVDFVKPLQGDKNVH